MLLRPSRAFRSVAALAESVALTVAGATAGARPAPHALHHLHGELLELCTIELAVAIGVERERPLDETFG